MVKKLRGGPHISHFWNDGTSMINWSDLFNDILCLQNSKDIAFRMYKCFSPPP